MKRKNLNSVSSAQDLFSIKAFVFAQKPQLDIHSFEGNFTRVRCFSLWWWGGHSFVMTVRVCVCFFFFVPLMSQTGSLSCRCPPPLFINSRLVQPPQGGKLQYKGGLCGPSSLLATHQASISCADSPRTASFSGRRNRVPTVLSSRLPYLSGGGSWSDSV